MLRQYFRVSDKQDEGLLKPSLITYFYSTVLQFFLNCLSCNKKLNRVKSLYDKTDRQLERALDVRTLLRMQSLIILLTKVAFEKRHKSFIKLQRHTRFISIDEDESSSDTSILYDVKA